MNRLPAFAEHTGHAKVHPIETNSYQPTGPTSFMQKWLADIATTPCHRPSGFRILDVGCGRGDVVFWLLDQGWDAWGVDINSRYINIGRDHLRATGHDPDRLRAVESDSYPLPNDWFDVVISDQVFEHVANLGALMSEVSRVSHDGTVGMHIFPARWRPVEVHMHTPFVHWLPKGAARRRALKGLLSAHIGAAYFFELPIAERVEIFARFSDEETFYRPLLEIQGTMLRHGIKGDPVGASRSKAFHHAPWLPILVRPLAGWIYRNIFSVCIETVQIKPPSCDTARRSDASI